MSLRKAAALLVPVLLVTAFFVGPHYIFADETQDQIQAQIDSLRSEIAQLQSQLTLTTQQKQTLQNAIKELDLQIQKLNKSITLTTTQIKQKDSEITVIAGSIEDTQTKVDRAERSVAESLRSLETVDNESPVITLLGGGTLSSFFDQALSLSSVRNELGNKIQELNTLKAGLEGNKKSAEGKRSELAGLQTTLSQQKQGLSAAKNNQTTLLTQTKNKESEYEALISQKKAEESKFEQDLLNYEKSLGLSVAEGSIPGAEAGILSWPLDTIRITQYFGNTEFATQNPQVYGGRGHNAIDLAVPTGTRVKAALDGVVLGTGNTDLTCPNASYGKWVFIKHPNGLSTLYAHLSTISVTQGQEVSTGDVIGYSGSTGYATGPHLHFGVYATTGSKIASFASASCKGKIYTMPLADPTAYLNPLSYLPKR
jgi:murein DD-endopeptidase MepM/ murein hydrolase activator NlpD